MSDCVFCTKLEQWVGNPKVCQRRVQVPSLFAGCSGCDFSPLSETVVSKTKMVFNDPPALENSKVATAWLSGDKLIGKPPVKGNYDYSRSSRERRYQYVRFD